MVTLAGKGVARDPLAPWHPGSTNMSCPCVGNPAWGPQGASRARAAKPPHQQDIRVINLSGSHSADKEPTLSQTLHPVSYWIP